MRVLLQLEHIPTASACIPTSVDAEWVRQLAVTHDVVVAVDENSAACSRLRSQGVEVHVSDKRHVHLPDRGQVDADHALANWLRPRHHDRPFDLVVSSSERSPFGPVRAVVGDAAWGVFAAAGPTALARRLSGDSDWLGLHGLQLWRAASHVAAADLVVSPVAPDLLGLDVGRAPVGSLLPPPGVRHAARVSGDLVVLVMLTVTTTDATAAMEVALDTVSIHPDTTLVVLHTPALAHARDVAPALAAAVPDGLVAQTVLVPVGRHERAGDWLDAADALVLSGPAELLVPHVARRSEVVPTVVPGSRGRRWEVPLRTEPPPVAGSDEVDLLPWTTPTDVADQLRDRRRTTGAAMVMLHTDSAATEAIRWRHLPGVDRFDVVVGALPRPPWASPRLEMLAADVLALHRRTWNAVADVLTPDMDLRAVVAQVADPVGLRSHTLGAVAVHHEPPTTVRPKPRRTPLALLEGPLPSARPPQVDVPAPRPRPAQKPAPRPAPKPEPAPEPEPAPTTTVREWAGTTRWRRRAVAALPWRLGLGRAVRDGELPDGVTDWVKQHTVGERARLLLPWRWGLLPRAMEGRW